MGYLSNPLKSLSFFPFWANLTAEPEINHRPSVQRLDFWPSAVDVTLARAASVTARSGPAGNAVRHGFETRCVMTAHQGWLRGLVES